MSKFYLTSIKILFSGMFITCLLGLWGWLNLSPTQAQAETPLRRVNVPHFDGVVPFSEMAVFWFGRVDNDHNYADVRVGYTNEYLRIYTAAFDRRLWYDTTPTAADLTNWDAVTVYLDVNHNGGSTPASDDYRFVSQFNYWEARANYQTAYRGNGSGWIAVTIPFTTTAGWRGNAPNDNVDDKGWATNLYIPFASLGLSGPPAAGTVWGLAMTLHDRDNAAGTPAIANKIWPETMTAQQPATWGQLAFGLPVYTPPATGSSQIVTVRHKLNGATVVDGHVGGSTNCGESFSSNFFSGWGEANYAGSDLNIQNQSDIGDWPCYSKAYFIFPLNALPAGKAIISATLTLHLFGGSAPSQAQPSLIQVFTVNQNWNEGSLTWNSAPLAAQNIASTWVNPTAFPGWPGIPYTWNVSQAVAEAYAAGTPVRLALYEADSAYHSGKTFVSSDTGDWNEVARPTLQIRWGNPVEMVDSLRVYLPLIIRK